MSGFTWLHLSDWHQKGDDFDREVVRDALLEDINQRRKISPDLDSVDLILFSGDLTFNGKADEFDAAYNFLIKPIFKSLGLSEDEGKRRLCLVPGNHDLDRSELQNLDIDISIKKPKDIDDVLRTEWKRKGVLSPFGAYANFVREHWQSSFGDEPGYAYARRFEVNGKTIGIVGLNSAWYSARNHNSAGETVDYGQLVVGERQVYETLNKLGSVDLVIALMHHSFPWLLDFDRDIVEERLSRGCHFIVHGHQHQPRVHVSNSTTGDVVVIPGGATYDRRRSADPRYTNAYNFTYVDFSTGLCTTYLRRWSDQLSKWVDDLQLHKSGCYSFDIPKTTNHLSEATLAAKRSVIARFTPALGRRFCDEIDLSIKHHLEEQGGIQLVRHEVNYRIRVASGDPERFGIATNADSQVVALAKTGRITVKPLAVQHFKVDGEPQPPSETNPNDVTYWVDLPNTAARIDYKYTQFLRADGVYLLNMTRFTHRFKLRFQKDSKLEYDFTPIGGFPRTVPKKDDLFEIDEMQVSDLCHPDQGYLIQWTWPGWPHTTSE